MSEFLAEASVLIQANTLAFRKELAAALATVPPAIEIPIIAVARTGTVAGAVATMGAAAQSASAASAELAESSTLVTKAATAESAAITKAAAASQGLNAAHTDALAIDKRFAAVEAAVARARLEVVGAASAAEAAEITLQRQTAASAAARELLTEAQLRGLNVQRLLATEVVATAVAMGADAAATEAEAVAHEQAAIAASHHATALKNVGRGSATSALAAGGLRGATLTANGAFIAGAAAAIGFGKAVQTATSFNTNLNVFAATVGATGEQMAKVSATAQQLGRDVTLPGVSAVDAAQAMTELAKAGLSVNDSISGARGVLQLATAAAIDNAQATELAASALNAFGLAGDQAVHVADVLTNAANESQGSIVDIGSALGQAAAVARQAGLSLESTSAILTLFARNGLRGSDAGTSLRTALIRLINPTDKAAEIIKDLGLNIRTASGAVDVTVFDQFARATRNMTAAQRDQALAVLFGQDAIRGAAILAREGAAGLDRETEAMNTSGSAAKLAAARTQGLAGAFENTKNQAAALGLTLGQIASGPLAGFVRGVGNLFESLNEVSGKIGDFIAPAQIDSSSASLDTLISRVQALQAAASFAPDENFAKALVDGAAEVEKALAAEGNRLVQQGFLTRFIDTFAAASPQVKKAMEDNVITPSEQAVLSASAIGRAFLAALPHTSEFFQSFGASAKSGIEDAAAAVRSGTPQMAAAMRSTLEDAGAQAKATANQQGSQAGATFVNAITSAVTASKDAVNDVFSKVLSGARLKAGAISGQIIDVQFQGGTPQQQLTKLQALLKTQTDIVDALSARRAPRAKIDKAKQDAIATQQQIDSLQSQISASTQQTIANAKQAADARKAAAQAAARSIQDANNAADQAVFDSFTGGQNRIGLAETQAGATERLSDDIAVQKLIANTASHEIAIIDKTVKDAKTRNAAIAARVQILVAAGAELDRLRKQVADTATENARTARNELTETLGKRLQLAELVGGKNNVLAAFDKAIADARKRVSQAKKLGLVQIDEKIALQTLVNDRKQFLEGLEKEAKDTNKQATTAFDLLTQFSQTFNQNAGNLINGNQPFAGPTGFTADIAQFLIRRQKPAAPATSPFPGKAADDKLVSSQSSLTDAILSLRDTIANTQGNKSTAFGTVDTGVGSIAQRWHRANQMQRQFQEA